MKEVTIVIPVYRYNLSNYEIVSLKQVCEILDNYPIVFVKPQSLKEEKLATLAPQATFISFPNEYFNGIKAYNKLMLSPEFYKPFLESKYILVYQLDSYVFTDTLEQWCNKGYDYIGAPWIKRSIYDAPIIKQYMALLKSIKKSLNKPDRQELFNKVGNGGLSLRKVKSHYNAAIECQEVIEEFNSKKRYHMYNEDVFWSILINSHTKTPFQYPTHIEALEFAFDKHPKYCYKLNNNRLPFGCHGWSKKEMLTFWKDIIF
ncbi:MAG: DUF5672 family protein [Bacteroidales bacterium]|nr:DUF5672 family protein [Bacteroidales bacterium]